MSQTLATALTVGTYSLHVDVGNPATVSFAGYDIQFLAGGTVLAEDKNTLAPATGTFLTSTVTYTALATDANLGKPLTIRFAGITPGAGFQTDFDNVRLSGPDVTSVPEPASLGLLGLGAAGLLGYGWRRRKQAAG